MTESTVLIDPRSDEMIANDQASQWRLMWMAFLRHKLAVASALVVLLFYIIGMFAEFLAPFDPGSTSSPHVYHPPQAIHFIDVDTDGGWALRPYVDAMTMKRDPISLQSNFATDPERKIYLSFFGEGAPYTMWGVLNSNRHFLTTSDPTERFYLFGADRLGRDVLSRTIHGTRVSMSIGLAGVTLSLIIGLVLGGLSGYYGGTLDMVVQRVVELILSLPTIPIWLGLSAAMPQDWPPMTRYLAITAILSLVGWTELARVVRGRFLALRTEDFVVAARLDGGSQSRIIFRHMMPSVLSHVIASVTLAIPAMIIAETALSFLGVGLMPPTISWGVLLKEAQNVRSIAQAPWLFVPGVAVCLAVLSLNFLGDGLRDAADPYANEGR
ncbi:peptide ABC transporter permease [Devosia yakushimensis]|uniref:Peptide ABC transporter permease n=1 Tax=Devosia yakushimensis TaxID=470028 RepID=A0ABQ5ULR8_9HYPH|nr:ABC transporter permease [Devosia yakushimensis]GLQ12130.1 peptide ABC transporter permease [Devosia yakushimensis]